MKMEVRLRYQLLSNSCYRSDRSGDERDRRDWE